MKRFHRLALIGAAAAVAWAAALQLSAASGRARLPPAAHAAVLWVRPRPRAAAAPLGCSHSSARRESSDHQGQTGAARRTQRHALWKQPSCRRTCTRRRSPPSPTQAPAAAVLLLGAYMAAQLLWGVATFRSCPEEADALRKVRTVQLQQQQGSRSLGN